MTPAEKLRAILKVSGLTQEALAHRFGVSFVSLNAWLNGRAKPRPKAIAAIDAMAAAMALESGLVANDYLSQALAHETGTSATTPRPALSASQREAVLTGLGDAATIDVLQAGQLQKLLKSLALIFDLSPSAPLTDAALLLDLAKQADKVAYRAVLTYPMVNVWATPFAEALHTGFAAQTETGEDLGALQCLAAVAAWRCGVPEFAISMTSLNGLLSLPGVGRLKLGTSVHAPATIRCVDGQLVIEVADKTIEISHDGRSDEPQWEPVRTMRVSCDGLHLVLAIDDVDPVSNRHPWSSVVPRSSRLGEINFKSWQEQLTDAWSLLVTRHREYAEGIARAIRVVVPLDYETYHISTSYRHGFGAIASTIGQSPAWTAQSILEEFQRMKLRALHDLERLHTATSDLAEYMSPANALPQTFDALVEDFYSMESVAEFWSEQRKSAFGEEEFAAALECELRHSWQKSLHQRLQDSGELTRPGRSMLEHVQRRSQEKLRTDPSLVGIVRDMNADFATCFRVGHVVPNQDDIKSLADIWSTGRPCPVEYELDANVTTSGTDVRGWKLRRQLTALRVNHPANFDDALGNQRYLDLIVPGAVVPDAQAVAGRYEDAIAGYASAISENGSDMEAWAGLATTSIWAGDDLSSSLGRFPEIVVALHQCIFESYGHTERVRALAKWLEPLLSRLDDPDLRATGTHEGTQQIEDDT